jgi:ribosomal protein L6P/L9E
MKNLLTEEWVHIPEKGNNILRWIISNLPFGLVTVTIKARKVKVKGPKGEITKSFRHMPVELQIKKQ